MTLDEEEWIEYKKVMEDVVKKSGLNKSRFYDLRGNHDNFGVLGFGSSSDFFSRYSLNGQLNRSGQVNSIVIEVFFFVISTRLYCNITFIIFLFLFFLYVSS